MSETYVWFEGDKLCAVMPALILFDNVFEPMWRLRSATVNEGFEHTYVCINAPRSGYALIRTGRGFARRSREKYYWVNFDNRIVKRVKHRPTKKISGGWMSCVELPDGRRSCFEWRDGRLVSATLPL